MRLPAYPRRAISVVVARQASARMGDGAAAFTYLQATEPLADAEVRVLAGRSAMRGTAYASLGVRDLPKRISRLAGGMIYGLGGMGPNRVSGHAGGHRFFSRTHG